MVSLIDASNSPSMGDLKAQASVSLRELRGSTEATIDFGPLGNFLIGQWSETSSGSVR